MEQKDFYSVKDIILGSRAIYQKNERYLRLLRMLSDSYDKNVKDFYYKLTLRKGNPEVVCHFVQSLKTLKGMLIYLQMKTRTYYNGRELGRCIKNTNGEVVIANDEYEAFVKNEDMNAFAYITEQIVNSDFATKLDFGHRLGTNRQSLSVLPSGIYIQSISASQMTKFNYSARTDSIDIVSPRSFVIDLDEISELLSLSFPAEFLSDYHKEQIDESPAISKGVVILSDTADTNTAHLHIREQQDDVILQKIKYKKPTIN